MHCIWINKKVVYQTILTTIHICVLTSHSTNDNNKSQLHIWHLIVWTDPWITIHPSDMNRSTEY